VQCLISDFIGSDRFEIDLSLSLSFSLEMEVNYLNQEVKVKIKTFLKNEGNKYHIIRNSFFHHTFLSFIV